MYISHKYKFIYFGPTKVASNCVALICMDIFEAEKIKPPEVFDGYCWDHHSIFLPKEYKHYFIFSSVRNPFIRELSKYNYLVNELKKSEEEKIKLSWLLDNNKIIDFEKYISWVTNGEFEGVWHKRDAWKYSQYHQIFKNPVPSNCVPIERLNFYLKCENLENDLISLPFVRKEHIHNIKKYCNRKYNFCENKTAFYFPDSCVKKYVETFEEDFINFNYSKEVPDEIREGNTTQQILTKNISEYNFGGRRITYINNKKLL